MLLKFPVSKMGFRVNVWTTSVSYTTSSDAWHALILADGPRQSVCLMGRETFVWEWIRTTPDFSDPLLNIFHHSRFPIKWSTLKYFGQVWSHEDLGDSVSLYFCTYWEPKYSFYLKSEDIFATRSHFWMLHYFKRLFEGSDMFRQLELGLGKGG